MGQHFTFVGFLIRFPNFGIHGLALLPQTKIKVEFDDEKDS